MMKEKKAMRRVVSLGLMLAMLIGLFPFMHIMNGRADDAKPISVRINGLEVCDAANLKDAISKKKQIALNTIDVVSGVITEADFRDLKTANMHTGLKQVTMNTMQVPSISDATVFDGYAAGRSIRVASSTVTSYKNAPDGNTDDNLWYGFNIVEDTALNSGNSTGTDLSEKVVNEVEFNLYAPVAGATPTDAVLKSSSSNYTVSQTIWSDTDKGFVSGKFVDGGSYKTMIMFKANTGYYFDANVKSIINNLAIASTATPTVVTSKVSTTTTVNDTLALDITYKTSEDASKLAIKGSIKVQLDAPEVGTSLPSAAVDSGAGYTVAKTVWRNSKGIIINAIDDSSDTYTAEVTLTTTDANVFEKNAVKITTVGDESEFTRGAATVVEDKSRAAVTNTIVFTAGFSRATTLPIPPVADVRINLPTPKVGTGLANATTTDFSYNITSTKWYKDDVEVSVGSIVVANAIYEAKVAMALKDVGAEFDGSQVKVYNLYATVSTEFNVGAHIFVRDSDISKGTATVMYTPTNPPSTCAHTNGNFSFVGPRLPHSNIPSSWSDEILAEVGGEVTFKVIVTCNDCQTEVPPTQLYYRWAAKDRTDNTLPISYLNGGFVQVQSEYTLSGIIDDWAKLDFYVEVSAVSGGTNARASERVRLNLTDYSKPEPYFAERSITKFTGENVTLEVLSRLHINPSATNITYEWRKLDVSANGGAATGPVIYTGKVFDLYDLQLTDVGIYHVTVTNNNAPPATLPGGTTNPLIGYAEVKLNVKVPVSELIPIEAPDITALDLVVPVTDQTPVILTAPANANYTIKHSWRSSSSELATNAKFQAGKTYIADIKFIPKAGYRMGRPGAATIDVDVNTPYLSKRFVEMGENGSFCRVEVRYSVTKNPNKTDQSQLKFVGVLPEKKTYGDPDFALSVQGGNGDGAITFTSSDEKVLEVRNVNGSTAIIAVVGSGNATITATKAAGKDDINTYNAATATTARITVAPKILVVKASDKTIKAGTTTEVYPVEISGFVKGDNEYTVSGFETPTAKATIPVVDTTTTDTTKKSSKKEQVKTPEQLAAEEELRLNKLCGEFEIIPEGGEPTSAYVFRYVTGTLTINRTGIADAPSPYENFIKSNSQTIEDRKNGIALTDFSNAGYFDAGTQLIVENLTHYLTDDEKALYNANINASFNGKELAQLYDITLKRDGFAVQPNGDVLVDIDLASSLKGRYTDLQVAYISDYGDVTIMPFALSNDKATFITDHFSKYALIGVPRYGTSQGNSAPDNTGNGSSVPQTSDGNPSLPFLIGIAIVSGGVIVVLKRKKHFFN